jgi:hypothetical protein
MTALAPSCKPSIESQDCLSAFAQNYEFLRRFLRCPLLVSMSVAGSPEILVSARSPEGFSLLRLARLTGFRTTIAPSLDEIGSVNMRATTWPLELAPRRRATSVG